MSVTIISNHHERPFAYGHDVPDEVHAWYDHLNDEERTDGWIHYRDDWYHLTDFMTTDGMDTLKPWHGYATDTYFSGTVIRISGDGETYQIGRYMATSEVDA